MFDFAFVHADVGGKTATDVGLELLTGTRHRHDTFGDGQQLAAAIGRTHAAVPPMVSAFTRRVG